MKHEHKKHEHKKHEHKKHEHKKHEHKKHEHKKHEEQVSLDDAVAVLEDVISGLRTGNLALTEDGDEEPTIISVPETVSLKLKTKADHHGGRLSIKLRWLTPESEEDGPADSKAADEQDIAQDGLEPADNDPAQGEL